MGRSLSEISRAKSAAGWIAVVLAGAAAARLWAIDLPFLESYNSMTRQVIGAAIARNFFYHGFNFFYPEIDANGSGVSLFNGEMPFVPYLAACLYRLTGGVNEAAARSVSVVFSMLGLWIFYRLAKKLFCPRTAVWATAIAAFSPLAVALSRTLQPEAFMGFASVGFVYFSLRYRGKCRMRDLLLAALFLFAAVGAKFYNAYLILLTVGWYWNSGAKAASRRLPAILILGTALTLALAWSAVMWYEGRHLDLFYNPFQFSANRGIAGQTYLQALFSPHYLAVMVKSFGVHLLGPVAAVLWAASWVWKADTNGVAVARRWMLLALLLMVVIWRTAMDHPYYQYPLLFPAALLAGWTAKRIWDALVRHPRLRAGLATAAVLVQLGCAGFLYRGLYAIPQDHRSLLTASEQVRRLVPKDGLVMASHWTNEALLYYCDRRGWVMDLLNHDDAALILRFDQLRGKGARYYVTSTPQDLRQRPEFYRHVLQHSKAILQTEDCLLFEILDGYIQR